MGKSIVIFIAALWMLALLNMGLLLRVSDEHARLAALRVSPSIRPDIPGNGFTIHIVNAPPDMPVSTSGPSTRPRRAQITMVRPGS